jgi:hypothetical protein
VALLCALAACSGSPSAPGTPTSITVSSTGGHVFLGGTETFTATVALSNSTIQALTSGTWGTDAASVATVVATSGLVTGLASGEVTVFVDAQGLRGTKRIRVFPNYGGIWFGTYTPTACTQTGDFVAADPCTVSFGAGSVLEAALNFTQAGPAITGQTLLGSLFSDPLTASVAIDGSLTVETGGTITASDGILRINQNWQLTTTQAGQFGGTLMQTWTSPTLSGQLVVNATLQNFELSAQALSSIAPPETGRASSRYRTLEEAVRGLLHRR